MKEINPKYLINLKEINLDTPIYRYLEMIYLPKLLQSKKNTLVKPFMWKDPFELFMSNIIINNCTCSGYPISLMEFKDTFYAQCWTMKKECDLMWRAYVPNNGAKLKTTIRKLYNSINRKSLAKINEVTRQNADVYIGKVDYLPRIELLESGLFDLEKFVSKWPISKDEMTKTLFVKRKEFQSESEVRIVLSTNSLGEDNYLKDVLDLPFTDLIEEIVIDPKVNEECFLCYKKEIEDFGYTGEIKHSDLYNFEIQDYEVGDKVISTQLYGYPHLGNS